MVAYWGCEGTNNSQTYSTTNESNYQLTSVTISDGWETCRTIPPVRSQGTVVVHLNNYTDIHPMDTGTTSNSATQVYHWGQVHIVNSYISDNSLLVWPAFQTPEARQKYAEIQAKLETQQAKAAAERMLIEKKATRLLRTKLTTRQRKTYERLGFFDVPSPTDPAVAYRIPKSDLILLFRNGKPEKRLCVHPKDMASLPRGDRLIGLKMFIEADEAELLTIANDHQLQHGKLERLPLFV